MENPRGEISKKTEQEVLRVHNAFWMALADRDVEARFSYCADRVTFIGSGLNEKAANKAEYIAINKIGVEQYPQKFKINFTWLRYSLEGDMAWVESEVEWDMQFGDKNDKQLLRNTVVLNKYGDRWLVIHVHGSMPDYRFAGQNYMINADILKKNIELEKQVYHRTKELNIALENLKAAQSQLIQSEKMASLGELTAGIAHEIQNPLNFVNNFSEVSNELIDEMNAALEKNEINEAKLIAIDVKQNLEKINNHGKRADSIVKGMLQHSRISSAVKEQTDINKLADEYLRLSYHGLRAKDKSFNASLETDFDESIGNTDIVPQDIGRVMMNLFTNAFYAINEKKKQIPDGYEPTVCIITKKINNEVVIKVRDNGNGIPKSAIDKIFQPFFTTKPTGQGTGLGLSLAYDIVKAHGGELKVEMKEGEGAEFILSLPLPDQKRS